MIVYHIPETSKVEISQQNTLSVPRGGEFRLTLSDGTRVHLNSLSELKYPVSFKGMNERTVELKGEAFFEIAKDSLHPFKVETQGILIQQFGTAFNVKSRVKGKVEVALVQGSIGIYTQSQKLHKLSPGQLAIWDASTDLLSVENKDLGCLMLFFLRYIALFYSDLKLIEQIGERCDLHLIDYQINQPFPLSH